MAQVIAITRIEHGVGDGKIKVYEVEDNLSELSEAEQRSLVLGGSAVEIGKGRKFTEEPSRAPEDEVTAKRDALIAKAISGEEGVPTPAAPTAEVRAKVS